MEKDNFYKKALNEINNSQSLRNYKPVFILKKINQDDYIIYAVDKIDSDDMIWYKSKMENEIEFVSDDSINYVHEWDFDINEIFQYLEDSYEIEFMDVDVHHGIWYQINEYHQMDEDILKEGMNNYIRFCINSGITTKSIEKLSGYKIDDIYPLYEEINAGFKIIGETHIGNSAIVLANKRSNREEYVTWRTSPTRVGGYDIGHYFTDYKSAYKDFQERSQIMLERYLRHIKAKCKPKGQER